MTDTEDEYKDDTFDFFFGCVDKLHIDSNVSPTNAQLSVLLDIPEREIRLMRMRFWPDGTFRRTLRCIAGEEGITPERIRQLTGKTLRRLRQPSRQDNLRLFLREE